MKLCYTCQYDGNKCDKAVVNVSRGELLSPLNNQIKERYRGLIDEIDLNGGWDICDDCARNHYMSGVCHGNLAFDYGDKVRRI